MRQLNYSAQFLASTLFLNSKTRYPSNSPEETRALANERLKELRQARRDFSNVTTAFFLALSLAIVGGIFSLRAEINGQDIHRLLFSNTSVWGFSYSISRLLVVAFSSAAIFMALSTMLFIFAYSLQEQWLQKVAEDPTHFDDAAAKAGVRGNLLGKLASVLLDVGTTLFLIGVLVLTLFAYNAMRLEVTAW